MKYCTNCGAEAQDGAAFCTRCGYSLSVQTQTAQTQTAQTQTPPPVQPVRPIQVVVQAPRPKYDETMSVIVKVFMIIGCVSQGGFLLPLLWCIPLTVSVFNSFRDGRPIGTGTKVCVLLFVNLIAGICLLVMNENA